MKYLAERLQPHRLHRVEVGADGRRLEGQRDEAVRGHDILHLPRLLLVLVLVVRWLVGGGELPV